MLTLSVTTKGPVCVTSPPLFTTRPPPTEVSPNRVRPKVLVIVVRSLPAPYPVRTYPPRAIEPQKKPVPTLGVGTEVP